MSDSGDHAREENYRAEERRNVLLDALRDQFNAASHELIKAVTILNSGALVAMLGFTQALVQKEQWPHYKEFALVSLAAFLFGAGCGPVAFFCKLESARGGYSGSQKRATGWMGGMYFVVCCSFGWLLAGAVIAGLGIYRVF